MKFTGRNLQLVRAGIELALAELHNQIATCPDVFHYEDDIEEIEAEQAEFVKLLARVDAAVARESR